MEAITPLGDNAITVFFGNGIDEHVNRQVFSTFYYLQKQNLDYVKDIIPAYASLTVVYDIVKLRQKGAANAYTYMQDFMQTVFQKVSSFVFVEKRIIDLPVCYDASFGTDMIEMSRQKQLSIEEIIHLHSSATYRVYMLGFLPGFAYMGKVNDKITMPRKAVPHTNVPAGSVGIADAQTGIYPADSPGGWNIIGRTPVKIFDAQNDQPCLFQPGDEVNFKQISLNEFHRLKK